MRTVTAIGLTAGLCLLPGDTWASPNNVAERRTVRAVQEAVDSGELERFRLKNERIDPQSMLDLRQQVLRRDTVLQFDGGEYLLDYNPKNKPVLRLEDVRAHPVLTEIMLIDATIGVGKLDDAGRVPLSDRLKGVMMIGGDDGVQPSIHPDTGKPMHASTGGAVGGDSGEGGNSGGSSVTANDEASARTAWNGYVRLSRSDGANSDNPLEVCSGILLTSRWVLTAGHCVRNTPTWVQVGGDANAWQANQFRVGPCILHPKAINPNTAPKTAAIGTCDFGKLEAKTGETGVKVRSAYDLALLELTSDVPETLATPRTLLLEASDDDKRKLATHSLVMFGYGIVQAPKTRVAKEFCKAEGLVMLLAHTRQRMEARLESDPLASRMEIRAIPISIPGSDQVFGAVCGDSGGALTTVAGEAWPREIVIGVLSHGNSPTGIADVAITYLPANRDFLIAHIHRPILTLPGSSAKVFGI